MKFSLIICTYKRPGAIKSLMDSVQLQSLYPNEILIIDGSPDQDTEKLFREKNYPHTVYHQVPPDQRGLTKQRNFGIEKVSGFSEVVCFLDDDVVLPVEYFDKLLETYSTYPDALGVGGYIIEDIAVRFVGEGYKPSKNEFYFDGWVRPDGSRFVSRKMFGLDSDVPPGFSPSFSHGRSISFLPPSGKTYQVEYLMGGVSSFRKEVFTKVRFSNYFEGYGLYEDADFSLRLARSGKLYCNTAARLWHFHEQGGRPDTYKYGKMVVRNGWYVWRVKNPKPGLSDRIKWNLISLLLMIIRFSNTFTGNEKKQAFRESMGRFAGWMSLFFSRPKPD